MEMMGMAPYDIYAYYTTISYVLLPSSAARLDRQ